MIKGEGGGGDTARLRVERLGGGRMNCTKEWFKESAKLEISKMSAIGCNSAPNFIHFIHAIDWIIYRELKSEQDW